MAIKDGGMKTNGPKGGTQRSAWGQWVGGPRTDRPGQTHTHPHPDGRRGGGGARGACGRGMRGTTGWRAMGTGGGGQWDGTWEGGRGEEASERCGHTVAIGWAP